MVRIRWRFTLNFNNLIIDVEKKGKYTIKEKRKVCMHLKNKRLI